MAPEAVSFDFTTLCAFVILLRAFYNVSATYAHSVELACGWVTVAAIGCALTTSSGYLALALITGGFVFLGVSEIFSTAAGVGPTIMLLLFCSSRNLTLRAGARSVATRVFVAAFSIVDVHLSWYLSA